MEKNSEIEVSIHLKPTKEEPSPAFRRLWQKLLAKGKEKSGSTPPDARNGECENGNGRNLQD